MASTSPSPILIQIPDHLDGPRVRLRPYEPADAPAVWDAVDESREHLAPWLPWASRYHSPDDAREFVIRARARWILREDLVVGVFEHQGGRLLGGSGLHRIDWDLRTFEIGYWLRRTAEGRGYMLETVQLLTCLAFGTLSANRVEIRMDTRNERSRAVPVKLGFTHEGTLRNALPDAEGRPRNVHVYALIPEEYRALPWCSDVTDPVGRDN